jgi:flagellin-like protein
MKGVSEILSVALIIAIAFALAFIILVWGRELVTIVLSNSYSAYQNYRNQTIMSSVLDYIFKK